MKTMEQMQEEYDELMAHSRASMMQGDYEAAERFFLDAQKVWEEDDTE